MNVHIHIILRAMVYPKCLNKNIYRENLGISMPYASCTRIHPPMLMDVDTPMYAYRHCLALFQFNTQIQKILCTTDPLLNNRIYHSSSLVGFFGKPISNCDTKYNKIFVFTKNHKWMSVLKDHTWSNLTFNLWFYFISFCWLGSMSLSFLPDRSAVKFVVEKGQYLKNWTRSLNPYWMSVSINNIAFMLIYLFAVSFTSCSSEKLLFTNAQS